MSEDFLRIAKIGKRFGKSDALRGVEIGAARGEFLVLVGPSGCGKSTLLNIIAGLEDPSEGAIFMDGADVTARAPAERDIAMVFQSYALYPNMTVAQNISFGMEMRGVPREERDRAVREAAATLQITPLLSRKPSQLSGGQRQRVAMGRALVRHPRVFLFDEPLSNLDAKLRVDMRTEIKRLHQKMNATIVYVTHDQIEAMTLATRIAVMRAGEVRQIGAPEEIYNRPQDMFVASFMGAPSMNFLRGTLARKGENARVRLLGGGENELTIPNCTAREGEVVVGLRPEHIGDLASGGGVDNGGAQTLRARVDVTEPAGADTYIIATLGDNTITARMPAGFKAASGEEISLACDVGRAVLFDPESEQRLD